MPLSSDVRSLVWTRTSVAETVLREMVEYREQVGARIRQLRLARGLTQDELADQVGVKEKTISRWESGRHSGYVRNVKALAKALAVSPEDITGTPPAPLGLGARADQIDGGFEEFRGHVASLEDRLQRIEELLEQRVEHDERMADLIEKQNQLLQDQSGVLDIIRALLGSTGEEPSLPDRLAQLVRETAAQVVSERSERP